MHRSHLKTQFSQGKLSTSRVYLGKKSVVWPRLFIHSITSTLSKYGFWSVITTMEKCNMGFWALTISTENIVIPAEFKSRWNIFGQKVIRPAFTTRTNLFNCITKSHSCFRCEKKKYTTVDGEFHRNFRTNGKRPIASLVGMISKALLYTPWPARMGDSVFIHLR